MRAQADIVQTRPPSEPARRIAFLDGWRVVAIALVVLDHISLNPRIGEFYAAHSLGFLADYGEVGVFIFFFISGYVVSLTAFNELAATQRFSQAAFYVRRLFRIAPPLLAYLCACLALGVVGVIEFSPAHFFSGALYLCNSTAPYVACNWYTGHTWSLAFEEQFYLLFPLVFAFAERGEAPRLFRLFLAAGVAAIPFVFTLWWIGKIGCVVAYGLFFAGFLCARRGPAAFAGLEPVARPALWLAALIVFMPRSAVDLLGLDEAGRAEAIAWYRLLHVAAIPILVILSGRAAPGLRQFLADRRMTRLGKASYSFYLWQQLIAGLAVSDVAPATELFALALLALACVASFETAERALIARGRLLSDRIRARAADGGESGGRPAQDP